MKIISILALVSALVLGACGDSGKEKKQTGKSVEANATTTKK